MWSLTINEVGQFAVEAFEEKVNRFFKRWLGLPPRVTSVALYNRSSTLRLPLRSTVEEFKIGRIMTHWMLTISADPRVRKVKLMLRSSRKFNAQKEIDKAKETLSFEEMRGHINADRHIVVCEMTPSNSGS